MCIRDRSDMMHKIKNSIIDRHDLDISSSFEILSILVKAVSYTHLTTLIRISLVS